MRTLAAHPDLVAAGLFGLVVLVYLWPVLLGGKILSPSSLLFGFPPWNSHIPAAAVSQSNPVLFDVPTAVYPWRYLARELLHAGTFPAWNPHGFTGTPFYTNPATGIFSLFSLPLWVLPLDYGIGVGAALKLWAAGFGCYLLARELKLGLLPGLLAGVGFAFSALNITWLTHESLIAVAAMLPWMVWLVERIAVRGGFGNAIGLAVVTAIGIGGGHAGMQVHVLVVTGLYALLRIGFLRQRPTGERLRLLALALGGLVMGVLAMAAMLVPEVLGSRGTIGTAVRHGGRGTLPGTDMPFSTLRTALFPGWWGAPNAVEVEEVVGNVPSNFNERTFYAGVVPALLACVALVARGGWQRKAPFAVLAVLGLAIPVHVPVVYWLATHLPLLADVQAQRLHFVYAFAGAMLAAFGLQAVLDRPQERRWLVVPLVALGAGVIALASAGAHTADFGRVLRHFATGRDFAIPSVLALTSVAWYLLFAAGVGIAFVLARSRPRWAPAIIAAIVVLAVVDMLHFAGGLQPMVPRSVAIPPRTPAIAYLQRHAGEGRLVGLEAALGWGWIVRYGLDDVRGHEPPQPTRRYFDLWLAINPTQRDWAPLQLDGVDDRSTLNLLGVLGARFVIADAGTRLGSPSVPLRRVYSGEDAVIYRNASAVPRAMVASAVKVVSDEAATRTAIEEGRFDPLRGVVVERDQRGAAALAASPPVHGHAAVVGERNSEVTLRATLDRRGLVVLNDSLATGWHVRVDGRSEPVVRVNDVMRGVVVPSGHHEIAWSYTVPGLRIGALISLLAALVLAGGAIALTVRNRRAR